MKKCFLRLAAAFAALAMLLPIMPAAYADSATPTASTALPTIEQQIRAYAKSLNYAGVDDDAAWALAGHGISGGGKLFQAGEHHPLTATILNSELAIATLVRGCTRGIFTMNQLGMDYAMDDGGCYWSPTSRTYCTTTRTADGSTLYTTGSTDYTGPTNAYDSSLNWMVGSLEIHSQITRVDVTADTVTYHITTTCEDRFDFNTHNDSVPREIATVLGSILFREFDWVTTSEFSLTVPNTCTHTLQSNNYHWRYDPQTQEMLSVTGGDWQENQAEKQFYLRTYYELAQPVTLRHDAPWELEFTVQRAGQIVISPTQHFSNSLPYIFSSSAHYLFIRQGNVAASGTSSGSSCRGYRWAGLFAHSSQKLYTVRLENVVYADGSNMPYVSVYDHDQQKTVIPPTPMDDDYHMTNGVLTLLDDTSSYLSGKDLRFNYINNCAYTFSAQHFELKIRENITADPEDCFTESTVTPTCAAEGGIRHTCSLCGYSYLSDTVPALEHRMGSWQQVTAPTCTADGQEQRTCADCGFTENRVLPAAGHSYEPVVIPATCTAGGRTTYTCHCGDSFSDNATNALGHDVSLREIMAAPTCTQEGQEQLSCSRCSYSEVHTLPATGHRYEAAVTQPTCTKQGYTTYTCRCGLSYVGDYTAATGHRYEAVITAPTCTTRGKVTQVCPCGMSYVSAHLPATGHSYENGTCTGCGIGDPNAAALTVEAADAIAYTVSGNTVTVIHDTACKVGYLMDGAYVKIDAIANGDGSYRFEVPAGITDVLLVVSGDVNGDGKITGVDKGQLNAAVLGKVTLSAGSLFGADVSNDGRLTGADKGQLNAVILGKTAFGW